MNDNGGRMPSIFGLKIDNHISVGHILTTISIMIGGLWWGAQVESRLSVLEKQGSYFNERIAEVNSSFNSRIVEIRSDTKDELKDIKRILETMNDKLDQKVDKNSHR